ncbi:MAG: 2-oxo-4-hydroxy-4-carboxy-5-ureidoimidazoline decarboxylase [Ferruginibacter sp.]
MTLLEFNKLERNVAEKELHACCGSQKWSGLLMKEFPFKNEMYMIASAESNWYGQCAEADWLEAFTHHPKIGDVKSLSEKFAGKEQAGVATATENTINELARANKDYEEKFGFIFIVCATGKSAGEMLRLLQDRLKNNRDEELNIAMGEQHKITITRFIKLIELGDWQQLKVSQLTTHVLDTSAGRPGKDITIRLKRSINSRWQTFAQGITNADGRIGDLLPPNKNVDPGNYKMVFETTEYFTANKIHGFYPVVEIDFTVIDNEHYHVPLLINPFGYSTYRGS